MTDSNFRQLSDRFFASPQIGVADIDFARELGITLIVNNRPEDESSDQTPGAEIAAAAKAAGIGYLAIPVTHAGFSVPQVEALAAAIENDHGKILAYCRSGTRSTLLWALARASMGDDPSSISDAAEMAGYDTSPVRPAMDMLAAHNRD